MKRITTWLTVPSDTVRKLLRTSRDVYSETQGPTSQNASSPGRLILYIIITILERHVFRDTNPPGLSGVRVTEHKFPGETLYSVVPDTSIAPTLRYQNIVSYQTTILEYTYLACHCVRLGCSSVALCPQRWVRVPTLDFLIDPKAPETQPP